MSSLNVLFSFVPFSDCLGTTLNYYAFFSVGETLKAPLGDNIGSINLNLGCLLRSVGFISEIVHT